MSIFGEHMETKNYNPAAQEAFAKGQIEIALALFKAALFSIFVLPMTLILKSNMDGSQNPITFQNLFFLLDKQTYCMLLILWFIAILVGYVFRAHGLSILHQLDKRIGNSLKTN